MFILSIADGEKLLDKADSSSLDLNTQLAAPVTATLTSFFDFAIYTPTTAYLEAGLGNFAYADFSGTSNSTDSISSPFFKSVSNIPLKNLSEGIFLLFVWIIALSAKQAEG